MNINQCIVTFTGHDTNPSIPKYRPLFLEHFDKKGNDAQNQVLKEPRISHCKQNNVESVEQPAQALKDLANVNQEALLTKVIATEDVYLIQNDVDEPIGYVHDIPKLPQAIDNLIDLHSNVMLQGPECEFVRNIKQIFL